MKKPFLLLGFEPFDHHKRNPSAELVQAIAKDPKYKNDVVSAVLPVSASRVPVLVRRLLDEHQPRFVLAFGLYGDETIAVERLGVNLCDFRISDADGETLVDTPVVIGGAASYFSTLPTRELYEALIQNGIPAKLSLSAGSYLCNFLLYFLLHASDTEKRNYKAAFFHLPPLPEMLSAKSIPFSVMQHAVKILLATLQKETLQF